MAYVWLPTACGLTIEFRQDKPVLCSRPLYIYNCLLLLWYALCRRLMLFWILSV